jgi:di/tricarboxylate transporter
MPTTEPEWIVVGTLAGSLVLFLTDSLRYDLVAGLVVIVLAGSGVLTPEQAFAGFGSPAVVMIGSMYVFGRAIQRYGVAQSIASLFLRPPQPGQMVREGPLVARVTGVSGLLSSVISDTGVVATLIPVVSNVARTCRVPASRLLMPLSFGALLGGLITVIGTSTNIAINGVVERAGHPPFGLLEFAPLGLLLLGLGCLYFLGLGRAQLPRSRVEESLVDHFQVPEFVSEVLVETSPALVGRTLEDATPLKRSGVTVLGLLRQGPLGDHQWLATRATTRIARDDVLIIQGEPDVLLALRSELGLHLRPSVDVDGTRLQSGDIQWREAVVPANSDLVGQTLAEADFRAETGLNVVAISQRQLVRPAKLSQVPLAIGDSLLVQGHGRDFDRLRRSRRLILLGELDVPRFGRGAMVTVGLLLAVLVVSGLDLLPLSLAALIGALALILTGCVRGDEAREAVDWSVLFLVGGMLALGAAFDQVGLGERVTSALLGLGDVFSAPHGLLALLLVSTVILTQLTTNVTAGVIMAQVAVDLSERLALSSRPLLMAVVTGASLALMSPVAHQANTMVVGPGDYRFRDFLRVGTPLTLLLLVTLIWTIPLLWPF